MTMTTYGRVAVSDTETGDAADDLNDNFEQFNDQVAATVVSKSSGPYTASAGEVVVCDTSGGAFTVNLPAAPTDQDAIGVVLAVAGNDLTIGRNTNEIQSEASNRTLSVVDSFEFYKWDATTSNWLIMASWNPRFYSLVVKGGNSGFGTTSPAALVHASNGSVISPNGNGDEIVAENSSASAGISILSPNNAIGVLIFGDSNDNDVAWVRYDHANQRMDFRTEATSNRMVIDSSGNVGINTTTPAEKLDVNGNAIADRYKLQDGGQVNFTLWTSGGDSTNVGNTTTETTILPAGDGSLTIADEHMFAGRQFCLDLWGLQEYSSGTSTLRVKVDGTTVHTFSITSGSGVPSHFRLEVQLIFSSGGDALSLARFEHNASGTWEFLSDASSVASLTGDIAIDVTIDFSVAHNDNRWRGYSGSLCVRGAQ